MINKLALLAPYIGLTSIILAIAALSLVFLKRNLRKNRLDKERQHGQ